MFTATSLGHQGWYFASNRTRVLVDPLLQEEFGQAGRSGFRMFPPRAFDFAALPPIDAVLLTHEHDDHFDLPSLCMLDRRIPLFVPARSSSAAHTILGELGFTVHRVYPGQPLAIGDLRVLPLSPNHVRTHNFDEWDVFAFAVRDEGGDGNLFSSVDVDEPDRCVEQVRAFVGRPGLWGVTNNSLDCYFERTWDRMKDGTPGLSRLVMQRFEQVRDMWSAPEAVFVNGGGFSLTGQDAWMNRCVFNTSSEAVCGLLGRLYPGARFAWAWPGRTFSMKGGTLRSIEDGCEFLSALPRERWPAHEAAADAPIERNYAPVCGRTRLTGAERSELGRRLSELARGLYSGSLFRSLYSLKEADLGGRRPTFALVLLASEERDAYVLEYDPSACDFVPLDDDEPQARVLAGLECWATDLLAILRGRMAPMGLTFGHIRTWNAAPRQFAFSITSELWRLHHPLVRPADYLALYRRLAAPIRKHEPVVHASSGPSQASSRAPSSRSRMSSSRKRARAARGRGAKSRA